MSPNAAQIAYWSEHAGERWRAAQTALDAALAPLGDLAIERGAPVAGERVLDVGCGCGDSTLALAERVGAQGHVAGLDVSTPMLERAAERVAEHGHANVELMRADAQTTRFSAKFDLVFSRFGVMFFADPHAAFATLRDALVPGGRLAFVCWQPLERNPWMGAPLEIAERHLGPAEQAADGEPGPFAFADADRIGGILAGAGFVDVEIADRAHELRLGADTDDALRFVAESVGMTAAMLRAADPDLRERATTDLRRFLAGLDASDGLRLPSAVWVVAARTPA